MDAFHNVRPSRAPAMLAPTSRRRLCAVPSTHLQQPVCKTMSTGHTVAGLLNYAPRLAPLISTRSTRSNPHNTALHSAGQALSFLGRPSLRLAAPSAHDGRPRNLNNPGNSRRPKGRSAFAQTCHSPEAERPAADGRSAKRTILSVRSDSRASLFVANCRHGCKSEANQGSAWG